MISHDLEQVAVVARLSLRVIYCVEAAALIVAVPWAAGSDAWGVAAVVLHFCAIVGMWVTSFRSRSWFGSVGVLAATRALVGLQAAGLDRDQLQLRWTRAFIGLVALVIPTVIGVTALTQSA